MSDQPMSDQREMDASALDTRLDALARFQRAVEPYLPAERLRAVHAVTEHARQRLAFPIDVTVVALAGPTGSGKSSLFNALAGKELSPVGLRRPTTGGTHACVWGPPDEAAPLLDWLRVPAAQRFTPPDELGDPATGRLDGLVLLDLPDFDSVERGHAGEVERMLGLVDVVIWVVDPQKYADQVVHEQYLRAFHRYRDVTLVTLNQADLFSAAEATQVLDDLRRRLVEDGLGGVPTMATSAVDLPAGSAQLRAELSRMVTGGQAARQRLAADVDGVVEELAELVGPPVAEDLADRAAFGELADGLADAAGVPAMADAAEASYRRRASAELGRLVRWRVPYAWAAPAGGTLPAPGIDTTTGRVTARLAARTVAVRAADGLPPPWPDVLLRASRSRLPELPAALAAAVAAAEQGTDRTPWWWRLLGGGQWLLALAVTVGLGWLLVGWVMAAVALPLEHPRVGPVPMPVLLLAGGIGAGALLAALVQPLLRWAGRRARIRARRQLRAAVSGVGQEHVVTPVRAVLAAYREARAALYLAAGLR